jgi:hypothetical protein
MLGIPISMSKQPASRTGWTAEDTVMPYYVYKIKPGITDLIKELERIEEFENFKDAKDFVKDKRAGENGGTPVIYKIIFAENPLEAEERLLEVREPDVVREWEK